MIMIMIQGEVDGVKTMDLDSYTTSANGMSHVVA